MACRWNKQQTVTQSGYCPVCTVRTIYIVNGEPQDCYYVVDGEKARVISSSDLCCSAVCHRVYLNTFYVAITQWAKVEGYDVSTAQGQAVMAKYLGTGMLPPPCAAVLAG